METEHKAVAIRYDIDAQGEWKEAEQKLFATADEAEAWCEAALEEGQTMAWAETPIGMQGSVEDVEYDDWKHVWEIAGWDGEGICEIDYED